MIKKHPGGRPKKQLSAEVELTQIYYNIDEAAAILGVHRNTIKNRIKDGSLKANKLGKLWKIPKDSLIL